jgi:hypothetical protein
MFSTIALTWPCHHNLQIQNNLLDPQFTKVLRLSMEIMQPDKNSPLSTCLRISTTLKVERPLRGGHIYLVGSQPLKIGLSYGYYLLAIVSHHSATHMSNHQPAPHNGSNESHPAPSTRVAKRTVHLSSESTGSPPCAGYFSPTFLLWNTLFVLSLSHSQTHGSKKKIGEE